MSRIEKKWMKVAAVSAWTKQKEKCFYCRSKISRNDITIEHVQPTSKGGTNSSDNIAASCDACNFVKGNMTKSEFFNNVLECGNDLSFDKFLARMRYRLSKRIELAEKRILIYKKH